MKRPLFVALLALAATIAAVVIGLYWQRPLPPPPPLPGTSAPPPMTKPIETAKPAEGETPPDEAVFEVVRIEPNGTVTISGRAQPNAEVTVLSDSRPLGSTKADGRGDWVFLPDKPLSPGQNRLSLLITDAAGKQHVAQAEAELTVPEPAKPQAAAVTFIEGRARLVPPPTRSGALTLELAVDDKDGRLSLSGQAPAGAAIRLFLDKRFIGQTQADSKGTWRLGAPIGVPDRKRHVLRAEAIEGADKVIARVETPYVREEELIDLERTNIVVVRPGMTITKLARLHYGSDDATKAIRDANRDQLGRSDRLYPGQVLILPVWP